MGLAQAEQLAPAARRAQTYIGRAAMVSVLVLLVMGILWRMSWKLAATRRHELAAKMAHAAQIEYLAYHDGLTGLPNRSLFSKLLGQSILQARRNKRRLGVLFLDLDHFKQINDTLGHDAGDQLLQEVAVRLQSCLRKSDTVARLGGDEFVVVLPDITNEEYPAVVARKIIAAVARPYLLSGQDFRVTASVGVSVFPDAGEDEQTLTKNADIAMYKAKEEGKNNFQIYSTELHSESLDRLSLESALRHALERRELQLEYQPKRDMASGRITGVEALLRWQHPDLGVIAPLRFLQVAEDIGLLIPIGRWVLDTVCTQNKRWQQQGLPRVHVAINLTARQFFYEALATDISAALRDSGMDAELLELEISEGVLLQDMDKALVVINRLKELGVRIAVDNFGVGYSSLSMLRQFPLDVIKIDRSFIRDITDADEGKGLAEAIVTMGRKLGMTVVAQGVETVEQVDFLRDHACDEVQGFYFNKPLLPDEYAALFDAAPSALTREQG
jgi:diguanylate cyclase (GGDEF)-like protein